MGEKIALLRAQRDSWQHTAAEAANNAKESKRRLDDALRERIVHTKRASENEARTQDLVKDLDKVRGERDTFHAQLHALKSNVCLILPFVW